MRRRDFITWAGAAGASLALPRMVRAQQAATGKTKRIGFLINLAETDPALPPRIDAFWTGVGEYGWTKNNLIVDYRYEASSTDTATKPAADLLALGPDLLFACTSPPLVAMAKLTQTMPIVFAYVSGTTVSALVQSFARPAGNITGFVNWPDDDLYGKRIDILEDLVPGLSKVALVYNPQAVAGGEAMYLKSNMDLAAKQGLQILPYPVQSPAEISTAIQDIAAKVAADATIGVMAGGDSYLSDNRMLAIAEVARHGLIAVWGQQSFTSSGGLITYAPDPLPLYKGGGEYAGLVLNGTRIADLPIQSPTPQLVVNLKTAKAQGITLPLTILARADQVIE